MAIVVVELLLELGGFYMDRAEGLTSVNWNINFKECVGEEEEMFYVKWMR